MLLTHACFKFAKERANKNEPCLNGTGLRNGKSLEIKHNNDDIECHPVPWFRYYLSPLSFVSSFFKFYQYLVNLNVF